MPIGGYGGGPGGGGHDEEERRKRAGQSAAASSAVLAPSFDRNGTAYVGGQSRKEEEQQAYVRNAGDTMPKESSKAREGRERVQEEARVLKEQDRANSSRDRQPPQQGQERQNRDPLDTPQSRERQSDLSAKLRGRMDALEMKGKEQFGERKDFDSQRQFDTARQSYLTSKQDIDRGKFGAMADRAQSAAGNDHQQGQSQSSGMAPRPHGSSRFASMAARADAAVQSADQSQREQGTDKKTGIQQG